MADLDAATRTWLAMCDQANRSGGDEMREALLGVLEIHPPRGILLAPDLVQVVCVECGPGESGSYPCPTAAAIAKALGARARMTAGQTPGERVTAMLEALGFVVPPGEVEPIDLGRGAELLIDVGTAYPLRVVRPRGYDGVGLPRSKDPDAPAPDVAGEVPPAPVRPPTPAARVDADDA